MNEKEEAWKMYINSLDVKPPIGMPVSRRFSAGWDARQAEVDSLIGELGHAVPDGTPKSKYENVICKYIIKEKDAEIDKLKNEIQLMKNEFNDVYLPRHTLETDKLKADNEIMREALEFYSDESSWIKQGEDFLLIKDSDLKFKNNSQLLIGGKRARAALEKIKELR